MKLVIFKLARVMLTLGLFGGCDAKKDTVEKGREAVKGLVTQPFSQLNSAKDSLKQSEEKQKAVFEEANK